MSEMKVTPPPPPVIPRATIIAEVAEIHKPVTTVELESLECLRNISATATIFRMVLWANIIFFQIW